MTVGSEKNTSRQSGQRFKALVSSLSLDDVISMQSELATMVPDRQQLMRFVAERTARLLGADIVAVAVPGGDEFEYAVMVGTDVPEELPRLHRKASLTGWCLEHLQSVRCDDLENDPRASVAATQSLAVKSILLAPLAAKGSPLGVLTALSRDANAFDEDALSALELLAGILASALAGAAAQEERQLLLAERTAALVRSRRSEELFRALAEHSDEIIYILEPDGAFRYVSPSCARVLGWTPEELQDAPAFEWVHPDDRDVLRAACADAQARSGRCATVTIRVRHKDGGWRHLEFAGRNLMHVPAVAGLAANGRDVTARVEAQKEIEFQARLLQTVEQAVLATDLDGRITFWNAYAERLYGWTSAEALGRELAELTFANMSAADNDAIMAMLAAGDSSRGEFLLKRKDGSTFPGYVIGTPIIGPDGQIRGYVSVSYDLTERRQLESQLRQSQKMQAVGELAGGVAHDFNNVLTAITSYAELLLQDEHSEEKRADLLEIKTAARRAAELTKKLLAFSRRQVMQVQLLEVGDLVRSMERMLSRVIHENILLDTTYTNEPLFVEADATQLEQVLLNLVVNARDAMPAGGTIQVRLRKESGQCVLRVIDDGVGMSEEIRSRIFEPFFTTKSSGKGTGLGLAVVYGIVQQFHGTIDVNSAPGKGAEFVVRLPLSKEAMRAAAAESRHVRRGTGETILVIDENQVLGDLAQRILSRNGYNVVRASSATASVAQLDGRSVDLVIADFVMRDMRGPELMERLAAGGRAPRVLYTSGYAPESCTACFDHGGATFLAKPWTPTDLLDAVRQALDIPVSEAAVA